MANLPVVERMNDVKTTGLERSPPSQKLISFSTTEAMIVAPAIQYDMKSKRRRPKNFVSLVKSYKKNQFFFIRRIKFKCFNFIFYSNKKSVKREGSVCVVAR